MEHHRRTLLRSSLALAASALLPRLAAAQEGSLFPFKDDAGKQVYNYRVPSDLSTEGLPGIVSAGAGTPEIILVEFFDYNCPYCRRAAPDLAAILEGDKAIRLDLVNNPILNIGSIQAAKVQQAILRGYGPAKAYAFHLRLFAGAGTADRAAALRVATDLGLDAKRIQAESDLPQIGEVIKRQAGLAEALGFAATPSFLLGTTGLLGYPGAAAIRRAIAATRACDRLVCA